MQSLGSVDLLAIALAVVYLLVGILSLVRQKAQPQPARLFTLYSLASMLWVGSQLAWMRGWLPFLLDDFVARLPLYGLLLLAVILLWFTQAYLRAQDARWGWRALGFAWIAVLLLVDINLLAVPEVMWFRGGWMLPRDNFILAGVVLGWCFFTAAATLITLLVYRRTRQPLQRNRIRYLAAGIFLVFAGEALFLFAYWSLGGLLHLLGVLVGAYAMLNARLPSFQRAVLRSLSYLITTGLAILFYLAVLMLSYAALRATGGNNLWLVGLLLAAALAVFFNPLLGYAQKWLDRLIAGVSHDPALILRQYSQNISNILDLGLLAKVVTELIGQALDIPRSYLFTVSHEKDSEGHNSFRLSEVIGEDGHEPKDTILSQDSALCEYLHRQGAPLTQSEIDASPRFAEVMPVERDWLMSLQMELFVPIHSKDEWIGLLALGSKNSGEPFWDDDQSLLASLADQTAVALENARLVESLVRLNNDFRRAIAALDQANRNLERLDRTKTEFISVASHELRTPLTLINGYSQVLLEEPALAGNANYAKMISGIHSGAQRLQEVLESMLDMAKIDTRELQLNLQIVPMGELIESLHKELREAIRERNQHFEAVDLASLPAIQADREALRKVFYHLLVNAIKYTPDGGKITVSGRTVLPSQEALVESGVEIIVSDTGIGIDPSLHDVIFTKFYQTSDLALHSSGKTKFKGAGSGLGLAIAKGIIDAHFGRIWVESGGYDETRCPGSQFHVFLPLRQPEKTRPKALL